MIFFFSSRRRHTRCSRDWSSDVCSSDLLMRVTDATLAFPIILLALVLAVTLGPSFANVVVAIAVILWARYARVIYGEVVALMERDFIAQARALGASPVRIIAFHLFPNTANTLVVLVSLQVGYVIVVE